MSAHRPPVTDWTSDFDHTDPEWVADPFPIWDELRETCPVAHTDRYGGTWLPVRNEDIAAVAYDTEHFTSRSVIVSELRPGRERSPRADRRRAAHHVRSAVPRRRPPDAAARVRAQGRRRVRAVHP